MMKDDGRRFVIFTVAAFCCCFILLIDAVDIYDEQFRRRPSPDVPGGEDDCDNKTEPVRKLCELLPFDLTDAEFPSGTVITVTCPDGYEFIPAAAAGASTISQQNANNQQVTSITSACRQDGSWTKNHFGACKKRRIYKYCPYPAGLPNAIVVETYIPPQNNRKRREVITDRFPPNIYHVVFDDKNNRAGLTGAKQLAMRLPRYPVGSFIRYACNAGFRLDGSDNIFCRDAGDTGAWTEVPTCTRVCYAPETPAYAVIDRQLSSVDSVVFLVNGYITYACIQGFEMISGTATITCNSDGTWNGIVPTCRAKKIPKPVIVECVAPDIPENAVVVAQIIGQIVGKHPIGGFIRYKCLSGYEFAPRANETITCQSDGTWSSRPPRCREIIVPVTQPPFECDVPLLPVNARILRQLTSSGNLNYRYPVGGYIEYGCSNGFDMFGERTITCTLSGWSSPPPTCAKTCGEPRITVPHVIVVDRARKFAKSTSGRFPQGSIITLDCASGYEYVNGSRTLICTSVCEWHPHPLDIVCRQMRPGIAADPKSVCQAPPTMENGYIASMPATIANGRFLLGTAVNYACKENFAIVGNSTYTCSEDGFWRPVVGVYETFCESTCQVPATPAFAKMVDHSKYVPSMDRYHRGGHIRYVCTVGNAQLIGDDTIWCHETGQWSSSGPICQVPCDQSAIPRPNNAHVVSSSEAVNPASGKPYFEPGSHVKFACDDGYNKIDGELDTIYCNNGGQWLTRKGKSIGEICLFFPNWMAQK